MPKKPTVDPADIEAFLEAVKGVKPLTPKKSRIDVTAKPLKPKPIHKQSQPDSEPFHLTETETQRTVVGDEFIAYKHASVSNKILRKLRKGQYNVDAVLDLHGMSVETARSAVSRFLQQCLHEGMRVALIIHGKAHNDRVPILKNKLNHWLRDIDVILAFCSAGSTHGSRGAIYVLLKHTSEENEV